MLLRKPLKNIINDWEKIEKVPGKFFIHGYTADGNELITSEVVAFSAPQGGAPGLVETQNSFYALGSPKVERKIERKRTLTRSR